MSRGAPAAALVLVLALIAGPSAAAPPDDRRLELSVVSSRAEYVSGGDALIEVKAPAGAPLHAIRVTADGRDVTDAFSEVNETTLRGLVTGLQAGSNTLEATGGGTPASLTLENHPLSGPIFSGPHQEPFVCETVENGLGPALDEDCSADTIVQYFVRSGSTWTEIPSPDQAPENTPTTRTIDGKTVPFIVRVESGTINRAVYRIAMLDDGDYSASGEPGPGWNGKLVYHFGGGCDAGYHQGIGAAEDALIPGFIQRGFAVATSTLNVGSTNCNDVLSAETVAMVKEHFIERFGFPRFTIGQGGSGGAIQSHLIAENYPGLLDGIMVNNAFPDALSIGSGITDCGLLNNYFNNSTLPWPEPQRAAVTGFAVNPIPVCESIEAAFGSTVIPDKKCRIPEHLWYHPTNNPNGARCTYQDHLVTIFGRDEATGFARRALDNVGVQYGLKALNDGTITIEQFLDLNRSVGGWDIDGRIVADRTSSDLEALRIGYETGRIVSGLGGLGETPVLAMAGYRDHAANPHDRFRNFSIQQRIARIYGDAGNYVIWTQPGGVPVGGDIGTQIVTMNEWLENLLADDSGDDKRTKVIRARPADARDACWINGRYEESQTQEPGTVCSTVYHSHGDPRTVAGTPITNDIVKCRLKEIDPADYTIPLTPLHLEQLQEVFPEGVCDYSQPGVNQVPLQGTWLSWGDGTQ